MMTREMLGRRIAEERKKAGLTQDQLATAIGMERTAISRIEQGRQGLDTLQLTAIADALGKPPRVFFETADEEPLRVLLRAPEAGHEDVRPHLEWLRDFIGDYEFLLQLTREVPA